MFSVPLGLDALDCPQASADYLLLAAIAHASLSPLLYEPREWCAGPQKYFARLSFPFRQARRLI